MSLSITSMNYRYFVTLDLPLCSCVVSEATGAAVPAGVVI